MLRTVCALLMLLAGLVSVAEVRADAGAPLASETAAPSDVAAEGEEMSEENAPALTRSPTAAPTARCYGEDHAPALIRHAASPAVPPPKR